MPLQILTRLTPPKHFPDGRLGDVLQLELPPDPVDFCHAAIDAELEPTPSVLGHAIDPQMTIKKTTAAEATPLIGTKTTENLVPSLWSWQCGKIGDNSLKTP